MLNGSSFGNVKACLLSRSTSSVFFPLAFMRLNLHSFWSWSRRRVWRPGELNRISVVSDIIQKYNHNAQVASVNKSCGYITCLTYHVDKYIRQRQSNHSSSLLSLSFSLGIFKSAVPSRIDFKNLVRGSYLVAPALIRVKKSSPMSG